MAVDNLPLSIAPRRLSTTDRPNDFFDALVLRVIDGDSIWLNINTGFEDLHANRNCRLLGIDAPDRNPMKAAAKAHLESLVLPGQAVTIMYPEKDKYGRPLVVLYESPGSFSVNDRMVIDGHATLYNGGPRQ